MNTDDLRAALAESARSQEPPSPDLRRRVGETARRRRAAAGLAAIPVVAAAVGVGALLVAGGGAEPTVATAADGGASVAAPGSLPEVTEPAPSTSVAEQPAPTTATPAPAPVDGEPEAPAPTAPATVAECGTVTVDALDLKGPAAGSGSGGSADDEAALRCFIQAVNAGGSARVTVVTASPQGSFTTTLAVAPGGLLTVGSDGTASLELPPMVADMVGRLDLGELGVAGGGCGTYTLTPGGFDERKVAGCILQALQSDEPADLTLVAEGDVSGAITSTISIDAADVLTVTTSGSLTMQLPEGTIVPEDVLRMVPDAGDLGAAVPGGR